MSRQDGKLVTLVKQEETKRVEKVPRPHDFCGSRNCGICFHDEIEYVYVDAWTIIMCAGGLMACGSWQTCSCLRYDLIEAQVAAEKEEARREALRERMKRWNARRAAGKAHRQAMVESPANAVKAQLAAFKAQHVEALASSFDSLLSKPLSEAPTHTRLADNGWLDSITSIEVNPLTNELRRVN